MFDQRLHALDAWRPEDVPLLRGEVRIRGRIVKGPRPRERPRTVLVEHRTTIVAPSPGQRPVRQRLGEDDRATRRSGDPSNTRVRVREVLPAVGKRKGGLVAPWDAGEAAVVRTYTLEVVGNDDQPAVELPVTAPVVLDGTKWNRSTVQSCADRPHPRANEVDVLVIQSEFSSEQLLENRQDRWIVDQVSKGAAPCQQVEPPMGRLAAAHLPLGHLVDDLIELLDGPGGKGVWHAQIPLQVEQVAVPVAHDSPPSDVETTTA